MSLNRDLTRREILIAEGALVMVFCALPLFMELPYRVNISVTWEGAYRMYLGQFPFKDFGLPMGYGFWLLPFIFFKIFGPYMFSLLLAQACINLMSMLALSSILRSINLSPVSRLLSLLVFGLAFVMVNFWPWYNHTVFVFQLVGLAALIRHITHRRSAAAVIVSASFTALSFFTKQDGGGLALVLALALLVLDYMYERELRTFLIFSGTYAICIAVFMLPLLPYDFAYWFNYGQPPHFSRLNAFDFLNAFFEQSAWIKFYLIIVIVAAISRLSNAKAVRENKIFVVYAALTAGILIQAAIIQVTSFSPATSNYYYHAFGVAFLLFVTRPVLRTEKATIAIMLVAFVFVWQSQAYWKYTQRVFAAVIPSLLTPPPADVVSMHTWRPNESTPEPGPMKWVKTPFRTLTRIKLPEETLQGLKRLTALPQTKKSDPSVLNLTNLSFLAYELGYAPETGKDFPLWYHKGVAFFDREADLLCSRVAEGQYDIILFEDMPDVDNFFPYSVRDCALQNGYVFQDKFISPTGYKTDSIEVYVRKPLHSQ